MIFSSLFLFIFILHSKFAWIFEN